MPVYNPDCKFNNKILGKVDVKYLLSRLKLRHGDLLNIFAIRVYEIAYG